MNTRVNDSTLDITEAGKLMNVHPKTVLDMIDNGTLPAGKIGRAYVLLKRDVMNHIEQIIVQQTALRMRTPGRKSANLVRQVRPAQVGVSKQHSY